MTNGGECLEKTRNVNEEWHVREIKRNEKGKEGKYEIKETGTVRKGNGRN